MTMCFWEGVHREQRFPEVSGLGSSTYAGGLISLGLLPMFLHPPPDSSWVYSFLSTRPTVVGLHSLFLGEASVLVSERLLPCASSWRRCGPPASPRPRSA